MTAIATVTARHSGSEDDDDNVTHRMWTMTTMTKRGRTCVPAGAMTMPIVTTTTRWCAWKVSWWHNAVDDNVDGERRTDVHASW